MKLRCTAAAIAVVAAMPLMLATAPGASAAADHPPCTIKGTSGNDTLRGTPGDDVICGLGGDDVISGLDGDDLLIGGPGDDRLVGGQATMCSSEVQATITS